MKFKRGFPWYQGDREMLRNLILTIVILSLNLATALWAIADEKESSKEKAAAQLDEVVVTATRTEKTSASAPASVSVITHEDIEKNGARSLDEAIGNVAGGYSGRNISGGVMDSLSGSAMTLRGIPRANKTLFMVDGVVINDSYSGSQRSILGVAPEQVDRVEVVKGPFSSLYGGYAVGGVVNVMTRMPEKREIFFKSGYGSSWDRGVAPDDLRSFYVSGGDRVSDNASFLVSYGYKATNGYSPDLEVTSAVPPEGSTGWQATTNHKEAARYLVGDRGDKTWWDENISLKAGYDLSDKTKLRFSFTNFRFEYDYDDPNTYLKDEAGNTAWSYTGFSEGNFLSPGARSAHEDRRYALNFQTQIDNFQIIGTFGYIDRPVYYYLTPSTSEATLSGGPGKISSTTAANYNADLAVNFPVGNRQLITVGFAHQHGNAEKKEYNLSDWDHKDSKTDMTFNADGKDQTWSVFFQDEIDILTNLSAYLGFRQDWWKSYDGYTNFVGNDDYPIHYPSRTADAFSPKAALVYQPFEMTTLRSSVGRSFRAPSIYELYSVFISRGVTTMAGPDLAPELTTSWDMGIEQRLWSGAKIGVTYFKNDMKDLVYSQTKTETLTERVNIGKAESQGVELEIQQRFSKDLKLFANYTYTDSEVTENASKPSLVGKKLVMVPDHMFNAGGHYSHGPFTVSLTGQYVSKRYRLDDNSDEADDVFTVYDPYFLLDARVGYNVTTFVELSFSMDNILDEDYFSYYKAPGRSWFSELTLRF